MTPRPLSPSTWPTWLLIAFLRLCTVLPVRVQHHVGGILGLCVSLLPTRFRRTVHINLTLCFPDMEPAARRVLARNHFKNLGISLFESAMTWWASEKRIQAISTIEGIEHITNAQAKGRGVILTTFHTTTLSIGARILNTNVPVNPLYRPTKNKVIAYVSACAFQKHAQRPILHTDIRAMVQILKTNGIVWYIADQSYRKKGAMMVPFFNIPTATNVFARRLQEMTQSEVLFYTCERSADGRYHVKVLPPLDWSALDAYHAVLDYHHHIEKAVRHNPSQYWWVHRRFKGLSSSDPDYYSKRQHFP